MALMQITMIPMGEGVSVGSYVADIQKRLQEEGVTFTLTDMATLIEGDAQSLLALLGRIYETPFTNGAVRVVTNITIDDRRDKSVRIGDKIDAVQKRL
ncbi:MAG: thiamine-binding protein [Desulfocapsa sp.]|nr:MAG: thiamine-binding protein [Desulfocapsa sp.]